MELFSFDSDIVWQLFTELRLLLWFRYSLAILATFFKITSFASDLILQLFLFIVPHSFKTSENVQQFIRQRFVAISNPDIRNIGSRDVISGHAISSKVGTEPMTLDLKKIGLGVH